MINFTEFYTDADKAMVDCINTEINALDVKPIELGFEFMDPMKKVLAGTYTAPPTKFLSIAWKMLFGNASTDDVLLNGGVNQFYTDDDARLLRLIRIRLQAKVVRDHRITNAKLAETLKVSPSTVSQILGGSYRSSPTKVLNDMWRYLDPVEFAKAEHEEVPIDLRYGTVEFIKTELSKVITNTIEQARTMRRISVFAGSPGLGKSMALTQYTESYPNTVLVHGNELMGRRELLESIAQTLGITRTRSSGLPQLMMSIINRLSDGEAWCILLDEACKVNASAIDPLRTISDNARVGIALVGNKELADKLQNNHRFELIRSRVCAWPEPVGQLSVRDIEVLYNHFSRNHITLADDSEKFFKWLHRRVEGSARMLVENLLPFILRWQQANKEKAVDEYTINAILKSVLNKHAI